MIGLFDPATKQLVWRGSAAKTLDIKKDPDKNYRNLEKAMAKLFKNYPPGRSERQSSVLHHVNGTGSRRNIDMVETLSSVIQEHHAFYEVLPYYVVVDDANGGLSLTTRRVHAGFDVDIYGESPEKKLVIPGPDPDYTLGYSELQKIGRRAFASCDRFLLIRGFGVPCDGLLRSSTSRKAGSVAPHQNFTLPGSP